MKSWKWTLVGRGVSLGREGGYFSPKRRGRVKEEKVKMPEKSKEKINLFKYKPFITLILPNVLRGFCIGIVSMAITIGYYTELIDGVSANYVIIITNSLTIFG